MKTILPISFHWRLVFVCALALFAAVGVQATETQETNQEKNEYKWAPFRHLLGRWQGTGQVPAGASKIESEWRLVMSGKYIHCRSTSKAPGDDHEDMGFISFDEARQKYVYRAFFSEGFVNQYVAELSPDGKTIVFTSESVENGPPGLKVKEILELKDGTLETTVQLASGDGPYQTCVTAKQTRVSNNEK